jgi:hypothetical protein
MATKKATKEKAVPPPAPPKVLAEQLHEEIAGILKENAKVIVHDENAIEIPADKLGSAVDLLSLTRALVRNTEADYKAKIKNITDPFAPYTAEKKSIIKRAQEVEHDLEIGLHTLISNGVIGKDGYETKNGCRLSLVGKEELVLDDPDAIPDEFLLPRAQCLDWGKIKQSIVANNAAVEAAAAAGIELQILNPIKGAHLTTTYTLRTKLPDELGN